MAKPDGLALAIMAAAFAARVVAQPSSADSSKLDQLLAQMQQLREENHSLRHDMDDLRREVKELKAAGGKDNPPVATAVPDHLNEQINIINQRVEDLDAAKVESAGHFPLKISGLVLMNSYLYAGKTGGADLPLTAANGPSQQAAGATFRNTEIGLQYSGAKGIFGAQMSGDLNLDFYGGTLSSQNTLARIRTADITLNWEQRSFAFALDKPILSPRNPDSLSQLGFPSLANSGNLWLWQPQMRYEERMHFNDSTGLTARLGVYLSNDTFTGLPTSIRISPTRPALQGRFELFHDFKNGRRVEIAPGFHLSRSLADGLGATSYAASLDWLVALVPHVDWTGFAFTGQDLSGLGIAALHQGLVIRNGQLIPVRTRGGWTQLGFHLGSRTDFNLIAGLDDDNNLDLTGNAVGRNLTYLANLRFRLASHVVLGPEIMQIRTNYLQTGILRVNRYDLALGYLF